MYGWAATDTVSWVGKCTDWVLKVLASGVEDCALRLSFILLFRHFFSLKQLVYPSLTPSAAMMSS